MRKRTKAAQEKQPAAGGDVEMADANASTSADAPVVESVELQEESVYREKELKELEGLVHPDLKADTGCSVNGLYELVGECL